MVLAILQGMIQVRCVVSGRVQRVGYRDYVQGAAKECGVCGWVQNQSNGTVQIVAQGTPNELKEFIEYIHEGSVLAVVENVSVEWESAEIIYDDFSVLL